MNKSLSLGRQVLSTQGVMAEMNNADVLECLTRHARCDWGDTCPADWKLNDQCHQANEGRIISAYSTINGRLWIITDGLGMDEYHHTTIMLPEEY
jgi:hypothetical protein